MDGILIINKKENMTSRDVVNAVSKKLGTKKVGHTGTLDPMASGVLILCINEGLKIVSFLSCDRKTYEVEVTCGIKTDTLDRDGTILERQDDFILKEEEVKKVCASFVGEYLQEVPKYSAVKVNGRRLYDYARAHEEVLLPKRMISIYSLQVTKVTENTFSFVTEVSKGTYIRSLVRDISEKLNILCTMSKLNRIRQGDFTISESCTMEEVEKDKIISLKEALRNFYQVEVPPFLEEKIKNGALLEDRYQKDPVVFLNSSSKVLAIYGKYEKNLDKIKPYHVFH